MKSAILTLILVIMLFIANTALSLRCGTKLVDKGDSITKVRSACGEPTDSTSYREYSPYVARYYDDEPPVEEGDLIEEWIYNFGSERFIYILTFRNGRLDKIETDDYGF